MARCTVWLSPKKIYYPDFLRRLNTETSLLVCMCGVSGNSSQCMHIKTVLNYMGDVNTNSLIWELVDELLSRDQHACSG